MSKVVKKKNDVIKIRKPELIVVSLAILLFLTLSLFLSKILKFDALVSDVAWYWEDSLNWRQPYNLFHVPAYPLIIALLRAVSLNLLSPILIMRSTTLTASIVAVYSTYKINQNSGLDYRWSIAGSLLLILWPFVGLTYAVYPIADLVAIAFFLVGFLFLVKNKVIWSGAFFGVTLITHKAL